MLSERRLIQIARKHQLERDLIGRRSEAKADATFDVHRGVVVERRPDLLDLLATWNQLAERAEPRVLLCGHRPLRVYVVRDTRRRIEFECGDSAVPGIVEDRVENEVPRMNVPADDRTDLGAVAVGIPSGRVVAELEIGTIEEPAFVGVGRNEKQAQPSNPVAAPAVYSLLRL